MTYEALQRVNKTIKTTDIRGKQYAEVNQRIKAFRMLCPNGSIQTEVISNEAGVVVMRATISDEDGHILGTGTAYEREGSSNINKTSYIENCETSAVGRALAMCGLGIDLSVASFEEVSNAIEQQEKSQHKNTCFPSRKEMSKLARQHYPEGSKQLDDLLNAFNAKTIDDLTDEQLQAIYSKYGD